MYMWITLDWCSLGRLLWEVNFVPVVRMRRWRYGSRALQIWQWLHTWSWDQAPQVFKKWKECLMQLKLTVSKRGVGDELQRYAISSYKHTPKSIQWDILPKKQSTDICYNMDERWKHYTKWKKPVTKDQILYDYAFIKCPEQANTHRQKADQWRMCAKNGKVTAKGYVWGFFRVAFLRTTITWNWFFKTENWNPLVSSGNQFWSINC